VIRKSSSSKGPEQTCPKRQKRARIISRDYPSELKTEFRLSLRMLHRGRFRQRRPLFREGGSRKHVEELGSEKMDEFETASEEDAEKEDKELQKTMPRRQIPLTEDEVFRSIAPEVFPKTSLRLKKSRTPGAEEEEEEEDEEKVNESRGFSTKRKKKKTRSRAA